ncbi:neuraminidase-like domain-containing protein [Pseudomonas sp.]|uniref:Tc toxin subunit A-related protein n=1 Tax=Pseudomonas sp. TaxID=306 RepID=UPI00262C91D4|nr:neuraminidase-like domain-containing protein [Pseudomonas sp.]
MSETLDRTLNEARRDAMLGYYLAHCISTPLKQSLRTPNDLYDYWLLDVQVSQAVPSSPVASAITSLQHYISRIHAGLEPGYEDQGMSPDETRAWQTSLHAYPLWSASQQLRYHPHNFLDPTLREDKSASFQHLENDLNQNRMQPATVLTAVQGYLSRFEGMASIRTLNGYIDGDVQALGASTYYFVGKSAADNFYYWRSLDLSQRSTLNPDAPSALAWSDWEKISLSFSGDIPDHSIRPVLFNKRLFIVWAECTKPAPYNAFNTPANGDAEAQDEEEKQRQAEWLNSQFVKFRLCFSYKQLDGSWSLPRTGLEEHCVTQGINALTPALLPSVTQTIAVVDNRAPPTLFLGIQASSQKDSVELLGEFFQAISVDQSLAIKTVASGGSPDRYTFIPGSAVSRETMRLLEAFEPAVKNPLQTALRGGPDKDNVFSSTLLPSFANQYFTLFLSLNQNNLQFKTKEADEHKKTTIAFSPKQPPIETFKQWNFEDKSKHIATATTAYDPITDEIIITSKTTESFLQTYKIVLKSEQNEMVISLSTKSALHDPNTSEIELNNDSSITVNELINPNVTIVRHTLFLKSNTTGKSFTNALYDKDSILLDLTGVRESAKDSRLGQPADAQVRIVKYSLGGKRFNKSAFLYLYTHSQDEFLTILDRYSDYSVPGDDPDNKKLHFVNDLRLTSSVSLPSIRLYKHVIMQSKLPDLPMPAAINNNTALILNLTDIDHESDADASPELPNQHIATARIKLPAPSSPPLTVIHGVIILERTKESTKAIGLALQAGECALVGADTPAKPMLAPHIERLRSEQAATVEFMDFSASINPTIPAIRLNTSFARQLVDTAALSLEPLFSKPAQDWTEPPLTEGSPSQPLDLRGAHGKYFRELFIYLPWTLAHYFNQQQQYAHAETWLHYLLDPRRPDAGTLNALVSQPKELSYACRHPESAHYQALSFPGYLRKALSLLNVDILLNRGDAAYRQVSPDSLAEAKLWYIQAQNLLGRRATVTRADAWAPLSLSALASDTSTTLRRLEHLPEHTQALAAQCKTAGQRTWLKDSPHLCRPLNSYLVARWDTLESRLHGLRHHLDISGKPLRPSLFAPPLSPAALLARQAQSGAGGDSGSVPVRPEVGHYRFQVMLGHALSAVDSLMQFGATLLTLIERKEQAQSLELQQQHAWELAEGVVTQHTQALVIDERNREALRRSRAVVQARVDYLALRLHEGISPGETAAGQHYLESAAWEAKVALSGMAAGAAMLMPNIFGTSSGGSRWEGAFHAAQAFTQGEANAARASGNDLDRAEQFNRRAQEWTQAEQQALLELAQIDALLLAHTEQETATRLQLRNARHALAQVKSAYQLLGARFTRAELYQWLNARLGTFYYALYDSVQSLCLATEACWQYETADDRQFFQGDAWQNASRGMLSAEALKLNLVRMNTAYLQHTPRDLEINKTVSLRARLIECSVMTTLPGQPMPPAKTWADHKPALVKDGTLCFELTQALFDEDYPGHTLRRIKHISVSLPAILGPYEDIKATLTQHRNQLRMPDGTLRTDLRAHQQIALSRGLDDSGMFTLNFDNDPRYLPFEYTGAVSSWRLSFPQPAQQKRLLESLTDIIIHVRYTARPGRSAA